jgi:alanyl-tRNA synthetase
VVQIGDFSRELCGGTHVPSGATIGPIVIVREESIGSNTRRVEALTGADAWAFLSRERVVAEEVARLVEAPTDEAVGRVSALIERLRAAEKELTRARGARLSTRARELADGAMRDDGRAVVVTRADGLAMDELRQLAVETRNQLAHDAVVVVGAATADGKAQLVAAVTDDVVAGGVEARAVLQAAAALVGGGAGGHGDLAQAGGREATRLDDALARAAVAARESSGA